MEQFSSPAELKLYSPLLSLFLMPYLKYSISKREDMLVTLTVAKLELLSVRDLVLIFVPWNRPI